ncbi:uncharacterized protein PV06_08300 [Exophiala oligosperma]|uniref:Uncharacterized protein n=1 Tax=Exophiala oligosperma TaxID=215243 RepID=A0A0D2AHT7_9EURO|nr:uncharacterized protein PV06_08300 [Exophiala oligosperma]KIW39711.1 hypothetical protein PV06_08300 [Exophiala oligosperma]
MAASVAKQGTDGARKGHDKGDRQQVKPDRSSRAWRHSVQDKEKDEDITEHRRKTRRIQGKGNQQSPRNLRRRAKILHKNPRLQ